jgi:hypothetical protein
MVWISPIRSIVSVWKSYLHHVSFVSLTSEKQQRGCTVGKSLPVLMNLALLNADRYTLDPLSNFNPSFKQISFQNSPHKRGPKGPKEGDQSWEPVEMDLVPNLILIPLLATCVATAFRRHAHPSAPLRTCNFLPAGYELQDHTFRVRSVNANGLQQECLLPSLCNLHPFKQQLNTP